MTLEDVKTYIRDIPDFPVEGVVFKDITPLLGNVEAFDWVIQEIKSQFADKGITKIVGVESRGFIFGAPLALSLNAGFVPVRKPGKLPADKIRRDYSLEYGKAALELHRDSIQPGDRVLIIDDLLATGGTSTAARELVEELGGEVVSFAYVIELGFLEGRKRLGDYNVYSLLKY